MSAPYYEDESVTLHAGDCLDVLAAMPDNSVDSVVCDPPYGLEFMGKEWDRFAPQNTTAQRSNAGGFGDDEGKPWNKARSGTKGVRSTFRCRACQGWSGSFSEARAKRQKACECETPDYNYAGAPAQTVAFGKWCEGWAAECLRVLKPGGHLLAFGGTRTWHRLAVAVEDAGFEVRDSIAWLYGSGFPKSLDVSKAIDKPAGATRGTHTVSAAYAPGSGNYVNPQGSRVYIETGDRNPATPAAQQWQGWGTALKPSHEPVVVARKPLLSNGILAEIGSHLDRLESLCSRTVSDAASGSAPTRPVSREVTTSTALTLAATPPEADPASRTPTGEVAASSDQTDTSPSESTAATFSNTVTSWRACWVELCELTSTSTTGTTSSTTTDLRTLSSCLSRITLASTEPSTPAQGPSPSLVMAADNLFGASVLSLRSTLALSAIEPATGSTQLEPQDGAGSGSAFEPIVVARKPLVGTVAANVLAHGTGALNVDGCRVEATDGANFSRPAVHTGEHEGWDRPWKATEDGTARRQASKDAAAEKAASLGRWPANVLLDGSQADALDEQSGERKSGGGDRRGAKDAGIYGAFDAGEEARVYEPSTGGASRFFPTFRYQAKAPTRERPSVGDVRHPTVKPLELMRWLVRLVTPPGGVVLEPFAGSGTTVEAALLEGFRCIAIEREADYLPLILARIERNRPEPETPTSAIADALALFDLEEPA